VANAGPNAATNLQITDAWPAGLTDQGSVATVGSYAGNIWLIPSLPSGNSATLTISFSTNAGVGGTSITNTVTITALDQVDPNATSASVTIHPVAIGVWQTVTVDNTTPAEGGTINYKIVVSNSGGSTQPAVQLSDLLPAGVTFVSALPSQGSYITGIWAVGSLPSGGQATLSLTATVNMGTAGTPITFTSSLQNPLSLQPVFDNVSVTIVPTAAVAAPLIIHALTPLQPLSKPSNTATAIRTSTATATNKPTRTQTLSPTATVDPTRTPTTTASPTLSPTADPTRTPTTTASPTLSPTADPTNTPTFTPTPKPTPSVTPSATVSVTPTP
jgi:uncharacterized repeat protein (TIGR01451 family)